MGPQMENTPKKKERKSGNNGFHRDEFDCWE
jgi:hypothetical protein